MANGPRPLVLCGPSGSGKSTLLKCLMDEHADCFGFSISHTTRKPRAGEVDGRHYHFVDREAMTDKIARGDFVESAEYSGNLYGTSKQAVRDVQRAGKICVLDIDVQGVKSLKKTDLSPKYVFVKPPSLQVMIEGLLERIRFSSGARSMDSKLPSTDSDKIIRKEQRLRDRGTETEDSLAKRLAVAQTEISFAETPGTFDIVIVNDQVKDAYQKLLNFLLEDINRIKPGK